MGLSPPKAVILLLLAIGPATLAALMFAIGLGVAGMSGYGAAALVLTGAAFAAFLAASWGGNLLLRTSRTIMGPVFLVTELMTLALAVPVSLVSGSVSAHGPSWQLVLGAVSLLIIALTASVVASRLRRAGPPLGTAVVVAGWTALIGLALFAAPIVLLMGFALAEAVVKRTPAEPAGPRPMTAGKIAFTRGFPAPSIYVMNADGTAATKLTEGDDSGPQWSPDGKRIVYAHRLTTGAEQIWVMDADGSGQTKLTEYPGSDDFPAWSPNGDRIAFVRTPKEEGFAESPGRLYIMNADGSNPTQLAFGDFADGSPTWSPDGKRLAFARYPFTRGDPKTYGPGQIYVINTDGTGLTKVGGKLADNPYTKSLSWSADGKKIVFEGSDGHIYVMHADGTGQTRLTTYGRSDRWPTWAPDGTAIAFQSNRDAKDLYGFSRDIYVINSDGTGVVRLTTFTDAGSPAWSPARS